MPLRVFRNAFGSLFVVSALLGADVPRAQESASFQGIGFLPDGNSSAALGVSGDGRVVVGSAHKPGFTSTPIRWANGIMEDLGLLTNNPDQHWGDALAASWDGSVIVGYADNSVEIAPFRWDNGTMFDLSTTIVGSTSPEGGVNDVSPDGLVLVGSMDYGVLGHVAWFNETEGVPLESPFCDFPLGHANAASADGSVIVGDAECIIPSIGDHAVRWVHGVPELLLEPPGGSTLSARAVSEDGSIIFGEGSNHVLRWERDNVEVLEHPIGWTSPRPLDVSADGATVVGRSSAGAWVWDRDSGFRTIEEVLWQRGVDIGEWQLISAEGISANGNVIVGRGINPSGQYEGWVAELNEPSQAPALSPFALMFVVSLLLASGWFLSRRRC